MTERLVIRLEGEYIAACQQGTSKRTQNSAVEWLEAQFSFWWATGAFHDDELVPGPRAIRPMIEIIDQLADSVEDANEPMTVRRYDYYDPGRWWL